MKQIESIVVAFDGEAKCGKTTIIRAVADEAQYQADTHIRSVRGMKTAFDSIDFSNTEKFVDENSFNKITPISAGNIFRAATWHVIQLAAKGESKERFHEDDADIIWDILRTDGITEVLQEDPRIRSQVSTVGNMPGMQNLGGRLFCESINKAYRRDGGSNLVIVDARDPVGHMQRNNLLGLEGGQISPASVLPIYIDTPAEVAAKRMEGDYYANFIEVTGRRHIDANHHENPVVRPPELIDSFRDWMRQYPFPDTNDGVAMPHRLDNHEGIGLDNIQYFAGMVAVAAQDQGMWLGYYRSQRV